MKKNYRKFLLIYIWASYIFLLLANWGGFYKLFFHFDETFQTEGAFKFILGWVIYILAYILSPLTVLLTLSVILYFFLKTLLLDQYEDTIIKVFFLEFGLFAFSLLLSWTIVKIYEIIKSKIAEKKLLKEK